jgi:hypothetical protein
VLERKHCGGFDLTNLWSVDEAIANDMQTVMDVIARSQISSLSDTETTLVIS